mgnify:CR=1 FL=1
MPVRERDSAQAPKPEQVKSLSITAHSGGRTNDAIIHDPSRRREPSSVTSTPRLDAIIATNRTVAFRPALVDIVGDVVTGLVLSQLLYWTPRATVRLDGKLWVVKAASAWWEECRVTTKQARRSVDLMVDMGLVERRVEQWNGAPTTHMRIIPEVMERKISELSQSGGETTRPGGRNDRPCGAGRSALEGETIDRDDGIDVDRENPLPASDDAGDIRIFDPSTLPPPPEPTGPAFEDFYAVYPRKKEPDSARKAWDKRMKEGVDGHEIIRGAKRHAANTAKTARNMIKYPASWLNAGGWKDGQEESASELAVRAAVEAGKRAREMAQANGNGSQR